MHLGACGIRAKPEAEGLKVWQAEFSHAHALRLPGFFSEELQALLLPRLAAAEFRARLHQGEENERVLADAALLFTLLFQLNDPALFRLVREISGCGEIADFYGRVSFRNPARYPGHYYPWHNDCGDSRLVGLSINLSQTPYQGGVFQLRRRGEEKLLFEHHNTGLGDAMLFRVSRELEHHVTRVEGDQPRLILVGWFRGPGERANPVPAPEPTAATAPTKSPVPLAPTARLRIPATVLHHDDGDTLLLRTIEDGLYHRLAGVGRRIWETLGETGSPAAASAALMAEYEAGPAELTAEVLRFGGLLRDKGLLEEIPA